MRSFVPLWPQSLGVLPKQLRREFQKLSAVRGKAWGRGEGGLGDTQVEGGQRKGDAAGRAWEKP